MDNIASCVVCGASASSSDTFNGSSEAKAFDLLCSLFQLSSHFRSKWQVRNSNFCSSCADLVSEATAKYQEMRGLQRQINQMKTQLIAAMASSWSVKDDDRDLVCKDDPSISNLRRVLGQCLSPCTVQVSCLRDDEILELNNNCKVYRRRRASSRSSRRSMANIDDDEADRRKCAQGKLMGTEISCHEGSAEEPQDSEFRGSDIKVVLHSSDDDFDTSEVLPKKQPKSHNTPHRARPSVCEHCNESFRSRKDLKSHLREAHNVDILAICKYCGMNFETECRIAIQEEDDDKQAKTSNYMCNMDGCKRTYKTLSQIRIHHSAKCFESPSVRRRMYTKHVCNYCGKTYGQANYLRHHINSVHEKNFKFCCELCGAGFQLSSKLDRHVNYVHSNEKRFQCEICNMQFKWPHMYKNHMLLHTGEKSFVCELCGKGFATTSRLRAHKENVHSTRQFACKECGKLFPSKHYAHNHFTSTHLKARSRNKAKTLIVDSFSLEPAKTVIVNVLPEVVSIRGSDFLVHPSQLFNSDLGHM